MNRFMGRIRRQLSDYWHVAFGACVVMAGFGVVWLYGGPGEPPVAVARVTAAPAPPVASGAPPHGKEWHAVRHRLDKAEQEENAAIAAQLAASLDPVFADAKEGAKPFAKAVRSNEAYWAIAGGVVEMGGQFVSDALGNLFGPTLTTTIDTNNYRFQEFVADRFRQHVLDVERLTQAIQATLTGYSARLRELEGELLVELRADLADGAWQGDEALPALPDDATLTGPIDEAIGQAVSEASGDFVASIARGIVSWVIGDMLGEKLSNADDPAWKKWGNSITSGVTVDEALKGVIGASGYDPEASIAGRVAAAADGLRTLLVEGDAQARGEHALLFLCGYGHPDPEVRSACLATAGIMEEKAHLGLREQMRTLYLRRAVARQTSLYRHVHGGNAPAPLPFGDSVAQCPPADQLLELARQIHTRYEKE